jgi:hypothetical protein
MNKIVITILSIQIIIITTLILVTDDFHCVNNGGSWCFHNENTNVSCLLEFYS